jgi:PAS domain S-box-containing protein
MKKPLRVLMVEDSESDAGLIVRRLQQGGYDLVHEQVETAAEMQTALEQPDWDIVLADYKMPQFSASAALELLKASGRDLPFIIVSGTIGEEKAVAMMKAGVHDYVMKHNLARLVPAVQRELKEAARRREHRRAEEALLASEATLSSILRVAPIGIGLVTYRVFGWANDHLSRMTGYSNRELQGQSTRMLYESETEFERVGQVKFSEIKRQGTGYIVTRWRTKAGEVIEVFLSPTPIDPRDLGAGVVFTAMDITERHEAVKALRESEERYRTLVENIDLGITLISSDYRIIMTNACTAGLFQKPFGELVGRECFREFERRDGVCGHCPGTRAMATGKRAVMEISSLREDGSRVVMRLQAFPHYGPDGGISGFIEVVEDITGSKKMEGDLRLKERMLDGASDSIFLHDLDGHFIYLNEAAYKSRGYAKEELLAEDIFVLATPECALTREERLRELLEKGELIFESAHFRKDGSIMPVEIQARVFNQDDRQLILSAARDITERKQAETLVKQGLDRLRQALQGTVMALANTVEIKDPYTAGHQRRVAQLTCAMARELGWSPDRIEGMQVLCFLHDMGKMAVPAEILNKPGKISPTEFSLIKVHSQVGYDILKDIAFPWPVALGVLQHHERLDGSGYPSGLTAEKISQEAKILGVADVVEAMASHRPYRPSLGIEKALEEITRNKGTLYDPGAVDVCVRLFTEKDFQFDG